MSNEQYLIVSYFTVGAACFGLGLLTYGLLRRSFGALTRTVPGGRLGQILRRLFLLGIILPAVAGFFSVTFRSCGKASYQSIISDRAYLVAKNQEQLKACLSNISITLLVMAIIVLLGFVTVSMKKKANS